MLIFFWLLQQEGQPGPPAGPPAEGGALIEVDLIMRLQTQYITINSGGTLSGAGEVRGASVVGIWAPSITGSQINVLGSFDGVSATFVRLANTVGSGSFAWTTQGSAGIVLTDVLALAPFRYFKLEANVAQTDVRTFVILAKF